MHSNHKRSWAAAALAASILTLSAARAWAVDYPEVEPNETKALATVPAAPLVAGDSLVGNTTGTSTTVAGPASADTFLIQTGPLPLGIYRHRLVITTAGTAGHTGTLRATNQLAAPADTLAGIPWDGVTGIFGGTTDAIGQTSSTTTTPPRYNQWYGFGKQEQLYYRVTGTASTTVDYFSTLETLEVTPTDIGSFQPGLITINFTGQGHTTDTDFWVYDSDLNAINGYGDDDSSATLSGAPIATTSLQSWLARNYAPGTYYLAVSNFSFMNNQPAASDDNFRTGSIADFPDIALNSSTAINLNLTFTIADSVSSVQVPNTKVSQYDINWFRFTVVPAEGSCCLANASCIETSAAGCANQNGVFNFGLTCLETTCVGFGACCEGVACSIETAADCQTAGGVYQGDATDCDPNICYGACCKPDGTCSNELSEGNCLAAGGTFQGLGTDCFSVNCGGACCHTDGTCSDQGSQNACVAAGGNFQGFGTACATTQCPQPNDNCATALPLTCGVPVFGNVNVALVETAPVPATCPDTFEGGAAVVQNLRKGLWYKVTGDGQIWTLTTCNAGTNFDTQITVFVGDCNGPICHVANDDMNQVNWTCALSTLRSQVRFTADLGVEYFVLVTPFSTVPPTPSNFQLDVTCEPPPPPTGRCCVAAACSIETEANCTGLGGNWLLNGSCDGDLVFSDTTPHAIPDATTVPGVATGVVNVPAVNVTDVVVRITFTPEHTFLGDLIATISSPDAITADLFARVGRGNQIGIGTPFGNGNDMNGTYQFGDAYFGNLWTVAPVAGDIPAGDYRASTNNNSGATTYPGNGDFVDLNVVFGGQRPAGDWTLTITDNAGGDTGTIATWSLIINGGGSACAPSDCNCPGDTNGDQELNGLDVQSFTNAVLLGAGSCADVNNDTFVDLGDIDGFAQLLTTGQSCP